MPSAVTLSNQTILTQIRKNLVDDMLDALERGQGNSDEFMRFLAVEPVQLSWDVYERLTRTLPIHIAIGRQIIGRFNFSNSRPQWKGSNPFKLAKYCKGWIKYCVDAFVLNVIHRHFVIEEHPGVSVVSQVTTNQFRKG